MMKMRMTMKMKKIEKHHDVEKMAPFNLSGVDGKRHAWPFRQSGGGRGTEGI
jgi:hypothetical protein